MVLCPVALAVGCRKCPVFAVCPLKTVIGDQPKGGESAAPRDSTKKADKATRAR